MSGQITNLITDILVALKAEEIRHFFLYLAIFFSYLLLRGEKKSLKVTV